MRASRRRFLGLTAAAAGAATVAAGTAVGIAPPSVRAGGPDYDTVRVPQDRPTIQAGVDAASPGDLVLVDAGTYRESVDVSTPRVTVRGVDRNDVVLHGGTELPYGVHVTADGVAVENLTAHHFAATAFYWTGVEGFRGSYLTAYNDGDYGVYAYDSSDGRFEFCYASGHPDAGFYLGRNRPFEAVVTDVVAEYNAWGYSGTSAGGDLTVRDSVWRRNLAGIVPNTLDTHDPPQRNSRIVNNVVHDNDNRDAPTKRFTYPAFGTGILAWGGSANLIRGNEVRGHENFGVALAENVVEPAENAVVENDVAGSGVADLTLAAPAGPGNRFVGNEFGTSLPPDIQDGVDASASERAAEVFRAQRQAAESDEFSSSDWRDQPVPVDQPTMPDPESPPEPAEKTASAGRPGSASDDDPSRRRRSDRA